MNTNQNLSEEVKAALFSEKMQAMMFLQSQIERYAWGVEHYTSATEQAACRALKRRAEADLNKLYLEEA